MITLEQIQEAQSRVNRMIEEFYKQKKPVEYVVPGASLELATGERYAGIILNEDGDPSHHLIHLPGDSDRAPWKDQKAWAESIGGKLPTRREQSLLFANLCGFRATAYWSAETLAKDSRFAWCQHFVSGAQDGSHKSVNLRAVAVRRVFI